MLDHGVNREAILAAKEDSLVKHFHTSFEHLSAHYGIRRGCYTVVLGTPSCGKSGLVKAYAVQAASTAPGIKVLVVLSEEKKEKYAGAMLDYADQTGAPFENITFFEMSKMDKDSTRTHEQLLVAMREAIVGSFADLVIIDNITTSRLYGTGTAVWDQEKTVWFLKELSQEQDIGIVAVAHTRSEVSDNMGRLISTEDHKGSKALGMEASYMHALQKFTSGDDIFVFSRTLKHRDHADAAGSFLLKYDKKLGVYVGDAKVPFSTIKDIFQKRDTLGGGR